MTSQIFGEENKDPANSPSSDLEKKRFLNQPTVENLYVKENSSQEGDTSDIDNIHITRFDPSALEDTDSQSVLKYARYENFKTSAHLSSEKETPHVTPGPGPDISRRNYFQISRHELTTPVLAEAISGAINSNDLDNVTSANQCIEVFQEVSSIRKINESSQNENIRITVSQITLDKQQEQIVECSKDKVKFRRFTRENQEEKSQYECRQPNENLPVNKDEHTVQSIFHKCSPQSFRTPEWEKIETQSNANSKLQEQKKIKLYAELYKESKDIRLRSPLVATVGASADSGTCDCGGTEIQSDALDSSQPIYLEKLNNGGKTGSVKNNKQIVKPFTKESLRRLESRTVQLVRDYGFQPRRKTSVEDGSVLPNKFEPFPANLYGRPLEEIDNFIYDETFCVVSKRFRRNYIHRFTATNSCFIFSPWNRIRRCCIFLSTNQYFDYMVMATILLNCVFLAMTETVEEAEYIFLAIYTAEMVIKTVAKGFVLNKYTYLRNPWNWLDFIVITSGYATIRMEVGNLAGLRTFRVLRALKTVSIMPGLKTIINALLHSFKQLAEVMTLTIFCLMVFALFALQVYMGELRNKCVKHQEQNTTQIDWIEWTWNSSNWAYDEDLEPIICGNVTGARHCNGSYTCLCVGPNPNHGYTSFDNFLWSMLTTFQLITLDYWEDVYNKAATYLHFLQEEFPRLLQDLGVPAEEMAKITFHHYGCPAHRGREVTAYLDETYPDNWIGNNNNSILMRWPPRSPDLTPLVFFLWGQLKKKVYLTEPPDEDVVRARIQEATRSTRQCFKRCSRILFGGLRCCRRPF